MLYAAYYAVRYIWSRKLRSLLTVLGIAVGVAAIVSLLSISSGMQSQVLSRVETMGVNNMVVTPLGTATTFSSDDLEAVRALEHVDSATLLYTTSGQVPAQVRQRATQLAKTTRGIRAVRSVPVVGADLDALQRIVTFKLKEGSYPEARMGAVVGASAAQGLVSSQNRLEGVGGKLQLSSLGAGQGSKGKTGTLSIAGLYAQVGGGVSIGFRPDDSAVVSVDTFKKVTGQASPTSSSLIVKADTFENVDLVESAVTSYFTSRDKQVLVSTAKSQVDSLQQEMYTFQIFFGGIGLIALVAGCIGAVNTVLTSVLERTREIGMMKAVGASYNYILALFILESAMLGVLGGVAGNVMSLWVSSALSAVLGSSNTGMLRQLGSGGSLTPQLVAFGFAMGLGASLVAGYYPAKQAARLDPITALRY